MESQNQKIQNKGLNNKGIANKGVPAYIDDYIPELIEDDISNRKLYFRVTIPQDIAGKEGATNSIASQILGISVKAAERIKFHNDTRKAWNKLPPGKNKVWMESNAYLKYKTASALLPISANMSPGAKLAFDFEIKKERLLAETLKSVDSSRHELILTQLQVLNSVDFYQSFIKGEIPFSELKQLDNLVSGIHEKIKVLDDITILEYYEKIGTAPLNSNYDYDTTYLRTLLLHYGRLNSFLEYELDRGKKRKTHDELDRLSFEEINAQVSRYDELIFLYFKLNSPLGQIGEKLNAFSGGKITQINNLKNEYYKKLKAENFSEAELLKKIAAFRSKFRVIAFDLAWKALVNLKIKAKQDWRLIKRGRAQKTIENSKRRTDWEFLTQTKEFKDLDIAKNLGLRTEDHLDLSDNRVVWVKVQKLLDYIRKVEGKIWKDRNYVFHQDKVLAGTFKYLKIIEGSAQHLIISNYKPKVDESWIDKILKILSLALIPLTLGTSGALAFGLMTLDFAISLKFTFDEIENFITQHEFHKVGLSTNSPSEFWLIASILSVSLDLPSLKVLKPSIHDSKRGLKLDSIEDISIFEKRIKSKNLDPVLQKNIESSISYAKRLVEIQNNIKASIRLGGALTHMPKEIEDYAYYFGKLGFYRFDDFHKLLLDQQIITKKFRHLSKPLKDLILAKYNVGIKRLRHDLDKGIAPQHRSYKEFFRDVDQKELNAVKVQFKKLDEIYKRELTKLKNIDKESREWKEFREKYEKPRNKALRERISLEDELIEMDKSIHSKRLKEDGNLPLTKSTQTRQANPLDHEPSQRLVSNRATESANKTLNNRQLTSTSLATNGLKEQEAVIKVWVNTKSEKYHLPGSYRYNKGTKQGQYMTEDQALSKGYEAAESRKSEPRFSETSIAQEAGRLQEKLITNITGWPKNEKTFATPSFGNRKPDYIPKKGINGNWVSAKRPKDALFIADSKYYNNSTIKLNDQIKGFIQLAKKTKTKTFILFTNKNAKVSQTIFTWANNNGVIVIRLNQTRSL